MRETVLLQYLPTSVRGEIAQEDLCGAEEIRVRAGQPLEIVYAGKKSRLFGTISLSGLHEMLNYLTGYSLHAMEEELRQGFFTIEGGHRVGICGHMSYHTGEGGKYADALSDAGGINIRVARELKDCAAGIVPLLRDGEGICNTLIFAPPGVGKTTYLRDCIRILSSGGGDFPGLKVGVADERSEIAACHRGVAGADLGPRTDVLDNCPKEIGMRMLLRSMSPDIIAVDELGNEKDIAAVAAVLGAGIRILGTIHAGSKKELCAIPHMDEILGTGRWRLVRLARDEEGRRHAFVYANGEEGIWVS